MPIAPVPELVAVLTSVPKSASPPPNPVPMPKADGSVEAGTPDENARMFAAQALGRIGPAATTALAALAQALQDPHPAVATAAKVAMKQIRG